MIQFRFKTGLFVLCVFFANSDTCDSQESWPLSFHKLCAHKNVNKTTFERKRLSGVTLYGLKLENETCKLKRS